MQPVGAGTRLLPGTRAPGRGRTGPRARHPGPSVAQGHPPDLGNGCRVLGVDGQFQRAVQAGLRGGADPAAAALAAAAAAASRGVTWLPASWELYRMNTRLYRQSRSGWWSCSSAGPADGGDQFERGGRRRRLEDRHQPAEPVPPIRQPGQRVVNLAPAEDVIRGSAITAPCCWVSAAQGFGCQAFSPVARP